MMKKQVNHSKFCVYLYCDVIITAIILILNLILLKCGLISFLASVHILAGYCIFTTIISIYSSCSILFTDHLTGVLSKDAWMKRCRFLKFNKTYLFYTSIFLNIKGFKYINEHYGQKNGDRVMKQYASSIQQFIGRDGFISRLGGDNFAVLVRKRREKETIRFISNIKATVETEEGEKDISVNSKMGVYHLQKKDSVPEFLSNASLSLTYARFHNSGDIVYFEEGIKNKLMKQKAIAARFRSALENREFEVYYQPKVKMRTATIFGAEALARWNHHGRVITPGDFVPLLEKEGLVTQLDFYVFDKVCQDLSDWKERGIENVVISSNFSSQNLRDPLFVEKVFETIERHHVDPSLIEMELTESCCYEDFDFLKATVARLKAYGIKIAIDDFGTGYSSVSMITCLNPYMVKLDQSFLTERPDSKCNNYVLIRDIVNIIKDVHSLALCEGVTTKEQAEALIKADCTLGQGNYYDEPLKHEEFENRLIDKTYINKL